MPVNSSGVYTRASATTPVAGQKITVTMHESEWNDLLTVLNKVVYKDVANTITASPLKVTSTDSGALETALQLALYRNSLTPAPADALSRLAFTGNDSALGETVYAAIIPLVAVATDASEEGVMTFVTAISGSLGIRFAMRQGFYGIGLADLGANTGNFDHLGIKDGVTAPSNTTGVAKIYVDTADGDLKVKFADGTVKTLATDT